MNFAKLVKFGRFHLFELEDQSWLPKMLRNYMTDYLSFLTTRLGLYDSVAPLLEGLCKRLNCKQFVDLCSGASGPWLHLLGLIKRSDIQVLLTDKNPNIQAFERAKRLSAGSIDYLERSLDARSVPSDLRGIRTIFSGFHHFRPNEAKAILKDAVENREPICVFEVTNRNIFYLIYAMITGIPLILLLTPFIKPFRFSRFFYTYIIPLIPIIDFWDGVVSNLRTYTKDDLKDMVEEVDDNYEWQIETIASNLTLFTYLVGVPKEVVSN